MKYYLKCMALIVTLSGKMIGQGSCKADAGVDKLICPGECVTLGGEVPGGDTTGMALSITYKWVPSLGLNNSGIGNPTACPTVKTTYTLYIYAINTPGDTACVASSSVTVDIKSSCYNLSEKSLDECVVIMRVSEPNLVNESIYAIESDTKWMYYFLKQN